MSTFPYREVSNVQRATLYINTKEIQMWEAKCIQWCPLYRALKVSILAGSTVTHNSFTMLMTYISMDNVISINIKHFIWLLTYTPQWDQQHILILCGMEVNIIPFHHKKNFHSMFVFSALDELRSGSLTSFRVTRGEPESDCKLELLTPNATIPTLCSCSRPTSWIVNMKVRHGF